MFRRPLLSLGLLAIVAQLAQAEPPQVGPKKVLTKLRGYDAAGGTGKRVFQIPIEGTIDLGLSAFVHRVVSEAKPSDVIVVHVKTFGGRVDAAVEIRDELLGAKAPTVAFVDQRAISAGALISLATDTLIMTSGASIGAATPVQMDDSGEAKPTSEKVVSYMRAEMRATAEAKGRRADLAEAMVDPDIEIPGVDEKGKLLTLTTERALELGLADARADSFEDVLTLLNLGGATLERRETHWAERIARALTDPTVSSLLMTFGVLGILMELYAPGHLIGGVIGATCLALFFGGQYAANLAGWEELLMFVAGAALLALEVFVLPGFGVAGVLGIAVIIAAALMAMVELHLPWDVSLELGYLQEMVWRVAWSFVLSLVAFGAGLYALLRLLGRGKLGRQLVLQSATRSAEGYVSEPSDLPKLLGKRGTLLTPLRPAGLALIDAKRVDVVSEGDFLDKDLEVEVTLVDGNRVVVRRAGSSK